MTSILYDKDVDLLPLQSRKVALLGYGNQGRPQALNLKESGIDLKIGAREQSSQRGKAEADGFTVISIQEVAAWADVLMLLLPDDVVAEVYQSSIAPFIRPGSTIGFGHGLAISAAWLTPSLDINVFLVAPKAQGRGVRNKYMMGSGVPGLYAVHQDPSGTTQEIALAYAKGIGCGRVGILPTTFQEETVCDQFSEQVVLCGGLTALIKTAFDTLVEQGFSAEVAYFECLYEVKLIADLLHERGITGMRQGISTTALFGDLTRGDRVIDGHVRQSMRNILQEIISGQFAQEMKSEFSNGKPILTTQTESDYYHLIEQTHRKLVDALQA